MAAGVEPRVLERVLGRIWTVNLLAAAAEVSTAYVRRQCIRGEIDGLRPDRYWLIEREAGDAWLARRGVEVLT